MAQGFSERVRWSSKTWSLNELVHRFGNQFPIIVNTISGFYGANEVEYISAGEVLRVHSLVKQRRMFVRDDVRGRIFSLPLNLTVKFESLKENGKKSRPKRLDEILDDSELPTRVALAANENASFRVGETRYDSGKLGTLTLYKIYEETFLRVNSIARGAIDKNVQLLPLYVQIEVSLAKGFKDGHREDWESLLQMYDRSVGQSKMTTINGLDDILVYDPTYGSLVNPQAIVNDDIFTLQDARAPSMLLKDIESDKGHDSLISRLSTFKIGGNKDGKRMAKSFTEYRDNTANILRYGNRNSSLAMTDLQEDKFVYSEPPEASTLNRKRKQDESSHIQKNRPPKIIISSPTDERIHVEQEFNQMTAFDKEDGEERKTKGQAKIEIRDRRVLDSVTEEIRLDKNHSDIQSIRPQPLERPILAKRTSVPTGRVSPMVKMSVNTTQTTAIVLNTADEVNQTVGRTNGEVVLMSAVNSPLKQEERRPKTVSDSEGVWEQQGPFSDSEVIDIRGLDSDKRFRLRVSQSTEEFDDTLNRPPSKSKKKSALKAGRRRSTRAKRHVSYSDTDTVYPLDSSHDDMAADDSELDSPFYSKNNPTVFAENWRSRSLIGNSRNPHTLPANTRRQTGSLVVNVLPVTSHRKKNSLPMTREHFHAHDVFTKSPSASFRYPTSIGVIPEASEEYQAVGLPTGSNLRQYDLATSRVRIGDQDTHRRYGSSVINVGNVRSDGGLTSSRKQLMEPAIINVGDNGSFSIQNDASTRRRTTSRAATSNRRAGFEWKQDAISSGRRHNHKMLTPMSSNQKRNGLTVLPSSDYGSQTLYNLTTHPIRTADNQRNFGGKVIRLNETRDGNMWDEIISDYEADKSVDLYSRIGTIPQSAGRPSDSNYLTHAATMSRVRDGIDYSSPSLGNRKNHLTHMSTPGLVSTLAVNNSDRGRGGLQGRTPSGYNREGFSTESMPRIYRDNQNVIRKIGVVAPNVVLVRK